jgi:hypothetical protein
LEAPLLENLCNIRVITGLNEGNVLKSGTATGLKTCRLQYYGPAGCGKRENLRLILQSIPPAMRLNLAGDDPERQIAFRLRQGGQQEWQILVQAVDCGRERFHMPGMSGQAPFDAIIFVVDSSAEMLDQSLASLEGLKRYLDTWKLDLMGLPIVLQYNNRRGDTPLPVDRLEGLLNPWGLLSFPAASHNEEGVRETLKAALGLALTHIQQNSGPESSNMEVDIQVAPALGQDSTKDGKTTLGLDYGPPLPGSEIKNTKPVVQEILHEEPDVPYVVPVKIPRSVIESGSPLKILLEIEIEES